MNLAIAAKEKMIAKARNSITNRFFASRRSIPTPSGCSERLTAGP